MREVRRADTRFLTEGDGVSTRHSFSYGAHYDPDNVRFGPVVAINTEQVAPGAGYDAHAHADVEIVTWVVDGVLRHDDTTGHGGDIAPGVVQRLSAGDGVRHTERNASAVEPLVFVQMMLASEHDGPPAYAQHQVPTITGVHPTVPVAADAQLLVVRVPADGLVTVAPSPRALVHVARGTVRLDDVELGEGDEVRATDGGALDLVGAGAPADVLVWQLG